MVLEDKEDIGVQKLINDTLIKKNLERSKKEMTHWYVSGVGSCMRGQYLARLGKKPDEEVDCRTLRVFSMGNLVEKWLTDLLIEDAKNNKVEVQLQVPVKSEELDLSGYADMLLLRQDGKKRLYEIKSKHSKSFWYMNNKGQGPQREHTHQLWTYMYLLNIEDGSIIYISKDDQSILEYPVHLGDTKVKEEVLNYYQVLNSCWKSKTLPPAAEKNTWQAKYCRYHKQCLIQK